MQKVVVVLKCNRMQTTYYKFLYIMSYYILVS